MECETQVSFSYKKYNNYKYLTLLSLRHITHHETFRGGHVQQLSLNEIEGSWELLSFELEGLDNKVLPWGSNTHGLLIYGKSGQMSVSINRDLAPEGEESKRIFDSILFYSGSYRIDGATIFHIVKNASNPNRIGKEMIRYASLSSGVLMLTSPLESFGRAILKWKKIE